VWPPITMLKPSWHSPKKWVCSFNDPPNDYLNHICNHGGCKFRLEIQRNAVVLAMNHATFEIWRRVQKKRLKVLERGEAFLIRIKGCTQQVSPRQSG
jgi:hypothetical protein